MMNITTKLVIPVRNRAGTRGFQLLVYGVQPNELDTTGVLFRLIERGYDLDVWEVQWQHIRQEITHYKLLSLGGRRPTHSRID